MKESQYPPGWDLERVNRVIEHYDSMTDEEMIAEDEAGVEDAGDQAVLTVPRKLLPEIRKMVAEYKSA